uniref:choice-of-anchor L domain-containing protein n=1 Tax=Flavobacterium sp. TaxID=239 RepID=UPI002869F71F
MKNKVLILFLFLGSAVNAQLIVNNTAKTPAQLVQNVLVGNGVVPTNIKFNRSSAQATAIRDQAAEFSTNFNATNLGLDAGILLTTGQATIANEPNNAGNRSLTTTTVTQGDVDLALLSGQAINNVSILEFDFVATGLVLNFDYVFASEEYPEWTASAFNDTFGFFLSGMGLAGPYSGGAINIALTPTTNTANNVVSIGNVNNGTANAGPCRNCTYYVSNGIGTTPGVNASIQYDGFTTPLRATAPLVCGETYHIKLAVANAGPGNDNIFDSAVFIKNFRIQPLELSVSGGLFGDTITLCYGQTAAINSGVTPSANILKWYQDGVLLPTEVNPDLPITQSGVYTFEEYTPSGCRLSVDDITIVYLPQITATQPLDLTLCTLLPAPYEFNIDQTSLMSSTLSTPSDYEIIYYNTNAGGEADYGLSNGVIPDADLASYFIPGTTATIWVRIHQFSTDCAIVKTFNLNVIPSPSGTISYAASPYCNNILTPQPITNTALTPGGTYSASPAGLIIDPATGAITPFGSTVDDYIVTYEIPATGDCALFTVDTPVSIEACTCTVTASSSLQTVCVNTPITAITYTSSTGATAGSVPIADLPPGVTGSFSGNTFTISGTPTVVGNYTFTVTCQTGITDTCTSVTTIEVKNQPDAGLGGSTIVCDSSTTPIDLYGLVAGEQTGGTWSRLTGTGGTLDTTNGTFTPALGATTSTFRYLITAALPCIDDSSDVTVTINPQPNAGTAGNTAICESDTTLIDLYSLIAGEQAGGTWTRLTGTGGLFNPAAGTFTAAVGATDSTFQYEILGTLPCVNSTSIATININPQPNAGVAGVPLVICDSSVAIINLFNLITGEQTGGTWTRLTGIGGTFDAINGTFTPATGATDSTFQYEILGTLPCVTSSSIATININAVPDAGTAVVGTTICDSDTTMIDLYGLINGEQTGGTWTQLTGTGGTFDPINGTFSPATGALTSTFRYTIFGVLPCVDDTADVTITIHAQPNAGVAGNDTICDSSTTMINLYGLISGEQTGGTWTRLTGTGGTFDAINGTFTPAVGATDSTFQYEIAGTSPCVNSSSVATIYIHAQPDAGTAAAPLLVCDNSNTAIDLFGLISGEQLGGVWTRVIGTGGIFDAIAGTFTPTPGAISSVFDYNIVGTFPCVDDNSQVSIAVIASPNAGNDGVTTVCDSSTAAINLYNLITGGQAGGTWTRLTGTGGIFNALLGTFTPAPGAITSTFRYTVNGVLPCPNDTSDVIININAQPNAGVNGAPIEVCENSTTAIDLYSLINGEQSGGTWTRLTGLGGIFDATNATFTPSLGATNSTFNYEISGTLPCVNSSSIATINVNAQPDAGVDGSTGICDSSTIAIDLYSLITAEQSGGTWARSTGSGGLFNSVLGTFTPLSGATSSTFTYSLIGTSPCSNDSSLATVNINAQPNAGLDGSTAICDSSSVLIDLYGLIAGEQTGGIWSRTSGTGGTFDAANGTFIPGVGATTSIFKYTLIGTSPCLDDDSLATVNINTQPNAGVDGAPQVVCESASTTVDLFALISGEQPGGTWARTSGTGGNFNASAGTFIPLAGSTSSTFTYTILGTAPCTNDSSLATVDILPMANILLTSGVSIQNLCINTSISPIQYTTNNAISASITSGGLPLGVNAIFSAGVLTISGTALETGTFNFVVSTLGGCSSASLSGSLVVKPEVELILTSAPITTFQSACMNTPITPIKYSVNNGATSATVTGLPTGISGVYNAGVFTISGSTATVGSFPYVVTTVGGCGTDTKNGTITINPNVTIALTSPIATVSQSICINEPIVPISYVVGNGATGASLISGTVPNGIQGTFNQITKVFTISGIAIESGVFTYVISTTGGCG